MNDLRGDSGALVNSAVNFVQPQNKYCSCCNCCNNRVERERVIACVATRIHAILVSCLATKLYSCTILYMSSTCQVLVRYFLHHVVPARYASNPRSEHIQVGLKTCLNKEFTNNNVRLQKSNAQASFRFRNAQNLLLLE